MVENSLSDTIRQMLATSKKGPPSISSWLEDQAKAMAPKFKVPTYKEWLAENFEKLSKEFKEYKRKRHKIGRVTGGFDRYAREKYADKYRR